MNKSQNQEKNMLALSELAENREGAINVTGLGGSEKGYVAGGLLKNLKRPLFIVVSTKKEAEKFIDDIRFYFGDENLPVYFFPPYNIQPFKSLSYHSETVSKRIRLLYRLSAGDIPPVVVTTVDALLQKMIPRNEITGFAELVMAGEDIDLDGLIAKMVSAGYTRSVLVEEPGDFSVRGGILDVFSPLYDDPVRIELFGDTVDSIRFFSSVTQRKTQSLSEAVILPAKEIVLKKSSFDEVVGRIRKQASVLGLKASKVREIIDSIKNEGIFPGMESLISLVYPKLDTFFDYAPQKALWIVDQPDVLMETARMTAEKCDQNYVSARNDKRLAVEPEALYLPAEAAFEALGTKNPLYFRLLPVSKAGHGAAPDTVSVSVDDNSGVTGDLRNNRAGDAPLLPLSKWIREKADAGCRVRIICSTVSQARRLISLLANYGIEPDFSDGMPDTGGSGAGVCVCLGCVSSGFVWEAEALAVITEDEIFGRKQRRLRRKSQEGVKTQFLALEDLKSGDLVVHADHGIGRYRGIEKLRLNGVENDFILITYKDDDKLYLPVDRMNMARKYVGVDGIVPILDKMGGKSWDKVKSKAKQDAEKMAGELLDLYARRKVSKGNAFKPPDSFYQDFEASFPFEETPDQLKAIDDVILDMEKETPMDRLVCGDVGYGKTEVALRAAFKSVNDGKQVAVLVPTTVLAEQHARTFSDRFEPYPVNVASLNRFRTPKEQKEIVSGLSDGKIDIVIGTHRLLQKDIVFRDLGLVVVDEEQRFGVKHKEKLKKMRTNVDVLALSATPIPRTLHMSLLGIRDISVISTPPEQRQPIVSYISEFDESVIREAVQRELERGGQVFFVHNNIKTIRAIAENIGRLVPGARIGVAHGRLNETELETAMFSFIEKEIDVLVCTTIIESGLDIPAANTMIVNRADRFGLSQIYQLRGRIGRGDEQAYAYLFIPRETSLGKDAQKRLKVLMEHTDLGSGFQIAMSDLQIRGGGAVLGASQSGHIAAVGYDMFLQLMENAVSELKGEPVVDPLDPEVNMVMSAFVPETYVPDIDQRLSIYRRLSKMTELREVAGFKEELIDRYGSLPPEATNILFKIILRILAVQAGVKRLDVNEDFLLFYFSEAHQKKPFALLDMVARKGAGFSFTPDQVLRVEMPGKSVNTALVQARNILKEIAACVNR